MQYTMSVVFFLVGVFTFSPGMKASETTEPHGAGRPQDSTSVVSEAQNLQCAGEPSLCASAAVPKKRMAFEFFQDPKTGLWTFEGECANDNFSCGLVFGVLHKAGVSREKTKSLDGDDFALTMGLGFTLSFGGKNGKVHTLRFESDTHTRRVEPTGVGPSRAQQIAVRNLVGYYQETGRPEKRMRVGAGLQQINGRDLDQFALRVQDGFHRLGVAMPRENLPSDDKVRTGGFIDFNFKRTRPLSRAKGSGSPGVHRATDVVSQVRVHLSGGHSSLERLSGVGGDIALRHRLQKSMGGPAWQTTLGGKAFCNKDGNCKADVYGKVERAVTTKGNNGLVVSIGVEQALGSRSNNDGKNNLWDDDDLQSVIGVKYSFGSRSVSE